MCPYIIVAVSLSLDVRVALTSLLQVLGQFFPFAVPLNALPESCIEVDPVVGGRHVAPLIHYFIDQPKFL